MYRESSDSQLLWAYTPDFMAVSPSNVGALPPRIPAMSTILQRALAACV